MRLFQCVLILGMSGAESSAQERLKPLDPSKAKTNYFFALKPRSEPFRLEVQLDATSTITGVTVFRSGESSPFQIVPGCKTEDGLTMELTDYDEERELLKHQDLNFDGFEDVQVLRYYEPHLGTSIFCIYTWNLQEGRFRHAPEIPDMNPVANPINKTITVHQDLFGGVFIDSTYRWNAWKMELIVENGRVSGSDRSDCGFTDYCSRLINGKMVTTASKPSGCEKQAESLLVCQSIIPQIPTAKKTSHQRKK